MCKQKPPTLGGVEHLIRIVNELSKTYPSDIIMNIPTRTKFLFRGVSNTNFELLPSVLRKTTENGITNDMYTAWEKEYTILKDFMSEASGTLRDIPKNNLYQWAEYAQHFGVPTRFLDWTKNPLVALYFACCNNCSENPAIWILNTRSYTMLEQTNRLSSDSASLQNAEIMDKLIRGEKICNYPILYLPFYIDHRMSAQASFFMVWGNRNEPLEQMILPEYEMVLSNLNEHGGRAFGIEQDGILLKLEIYNDRKHEILRQLSILGINEKTLFPGLDGIGNYIERKYRFYSDETF